MKTAHRRIRRPGYQALQDRATRYRWIVPAIIALAYVLVSMDHLDVSPPVWEDEPWLAAASYKLATQGTYGSDLFAGYYGSDRHLYQMPVYSLLQAGVFKVAGLGVFQMRLLPVTFGLLLLLLVFVVGRQIAGPRVGLLAMLLLFGMRLTAVFLFPVWEGTGIPLLDIARISRYDIAVPVFGLAGFWLFNRAEARPRPRLYLLVGVLIGLSSLSHLTGAFWLPALFMVMFYRRGWTLFRQGTLYFMLGGFLLTWLPWLAYIASGWADFLGQNLLVADRFDVLNPHFYLENLKYEYRRYRSLIPLDVSGTWHVLPFGTAVAMVGIPLALAGMFRRNERRSGDRPFVLGVVLLIQGLLFALLLEKKVYSYLIALWPLATLALAWLGIQLWDRRKKGFSRWALLVVLTVLLLEGAWRIGYRRTLAMHTTPYDQYTSQIAAHLRPGARVLGPHSFWMGLHPFEYRTWLLPVQLSDSLYHHDPVPLDQALERVDPDVILLGHYMIRYFNEIADPRNPHHAQYLGYQAFMARHRATLVGEVTDSTYGTMRIYEIHAPSATR